MSSDAAPRVLVLGGGGYVGGRLCADLAQAGFAVTATARSAGAVDAPGVDSVVLDTAAATATDDIAHLARGAQALISLVSANEVQAAQDEAAAIALSLRTARALAAAARAARVPRVLYWSTVHVYGPLVGTIGEDRPPGPRAGYGRAHLAAEEILRAELGGSAVALAIVRMSNAVGPPLKPQVDRWTLLANDLARGFARDGVLRLRSAGLAFRDFLPLADATAAARHLLALPLAQAAGTFNLAQGRVLRVLELAQRMARLAQPLAGTLPPVTALPPAPGEADAAPFTLDTARLRATGFVPAGDLDRELADLLAFAWRHFRD